MIFKSVGVCACVCPYPTSYILISFKQITLTQQQFNEIVITYNQL